MKKNRLMQELNRELDGVRVSRNLKERILAEAAVSRAPSRRKSFSVRPLAIAAAVMVVFGLTAGVAALRQEKPDLSASTLSASKVKTAQEMVWVRLPEGLYHAKSDCEKVQDPVSMQLETARAAGLKGCSNCIETDSSIADDLVWMTSSGMYYHSVKDCSGMMDAVGVVELEAKTLGYFSCPVCMDGEALTFVPPMQTAPVIEITPMPTPVQMAQPTPTPMATVEPTQPPVQMAQPTPMVTVEPMQPPVQMAQPTSTPMATVEPTQPPVSEQEMFVSISEDGYYHADMNCSDHGGVAEFTVKEAVVAGCLPCEACVERTVWISEESDSWHLAKNCSGIENAMAYVLMPGEQMDLPGCLTCMEGGFPVWMSDSHASYHWDENCFNLNDPIQVMESVATEAGKNPCGICMSIPTVEASKGSDAVVWINEGGYYHWDENCPRSADAQSCTEHEAIAYGKVSCPDCSAQQMETEEISVWMTDGGVYCHAEEYCSGMENAKSVSLKEAMLSGKEICSTCMARTIWIDESAQQWHLAKNCSGMQDAQMMILDPGEQIDLEGCVVCAAGGIPVWATENGTFYHWNEHCSGMENALQIMESEALESGKQACPTCMSIETGAVDKYSDGSEQSEETYVWATEYGIFYHSNAYCSGMKGLEYMDKDVAIEFGKMRCPNCMNSTVWVSDESVYYHTAQYCSGMKDAVTISEQEALDMNLQLCPGCIWRDGESPEEVEMDSDRVWWHPDDEFYYHSDAYCGSTIFTAADARGQGKAACAVCAENVEDDDFVWINHDNHFHLDKYCTERPVYESCFESEAVETGRAPCVLCMNYVWMTDDGVFYHTKQDCSGMQDPQGTNVVEALEQGKQPCPTCAKQILHYDSETSE